MRFILSLLLPLAVLLNDVSGYYEFHSRKTREPVTIIPKSRTIVVQKKIEQRLDHFNPTDNRTWLMRYLVNDEHFKPGGPIGIHIGGEWEITTGALVGGVTYDIAKELNGYLFYTEHRFYGQSHPTPDASTKNLQYLSMHQAIADLAYFVEYVKRTIPGLENSKVYIVGGSYAGSMATWFRLKYPHLVDAALASSAPLKANAVFPGYYEVVGKVLKEYGGQRCHDIIQKGTQQLLELTKQKDGAKQISEMFNLCQTVDLDSPLDFGWFISDVMGLFANMAQYHLKGDIEYYCKEIVNFAENNTELYGLGKFFASRFSSCSDSNYENAVESMRETKWGLTSDVRQWVYTVCTEYANYPTDDSKDQPFTHGINNLDLYVSFCRDLFGEEFKTNAYPILLDGLNHYNMFYGGMTPKVTKIIFTHGTVDPWHVSGALEDLNEEAPAILIPGTSHCQDLQATSPMDSDELKAAQRKTRELMKKWLQ